MNFFAQQLQQMKVKNVDAEVRFKYLKAAEVLDDGEYYTDASKDGGIKEAISKAATEAGILSSQPFLSHLVSFVRAEFDTQT